MKKPSLFLLAAALLVCPPLALAQSTLAINPAALTFNGSSGNVTVQRVLVESTGKSPLVVSGVSFAGKGFALSTIAFPLTIASGRSDYFYIRGNPGKSTTAVTGRMTVNSNGGSKTVALTITPVSTTTQHTVALAWKPSSSSSVDSYEVDREQGTSGSFSRLASTGTSTSWSDNTVQSGQKYTYEVKALTATGATSGPSNTVSVSIP